jgi:uncharacterized protein YidB (DUF937 family)
MSDKQYDNRNSGALFVNEKKTEAKHPNFRGQAQVVGPNGEVIDLWMSAWVKQGKNGEFLSVSFTPKDVGASTGSGSFSKLASGQPISSDNHTKTISGKVPELDDEMPF